MPVKRDLIGLGVIYAAGQILLQAISFLLLPLYTHFLTVEQFGQFSITTTISDVTGFLPVLGIYSGYNRFYMDYSPLHRIRLRNTAFTFAVLFGPAFILFLMAVAALAGPLFAQIDRFPTVMAYICINNLCIQISTIFMCTYYLEYSAKKITAISIVKTVACVLLTVFFLVAARGGIAEIYKAQMIASIGQLIYFLIQNRKTLRPEMDRDMLRKMLKFGVGLIPSNLSASALNFSDRFFMAGFRSYNETGVYSAGYKIGIQIDPLFSTPFRQIFTTYKYENWKNGDIEEKFNQLFLQYHLLGCFLILCIAVASRTVIHVFTKPEYLPAYTVVPLILSAYFLFGETRFFNLGIELYNKTYLDSAVLICGGIVNVGLNIFLIPSLGMHGAALSTVLSYTLVLLLYAVISGKLHRVRYRYKKPALICVLTAALYLVYYMVSLVLKQIVFDLLLCVLLPSIYVLVCMAFGLIRREQLRELLKTLPELLRKDQH